MISDKLNKKTERIKKNQGETRVEKNVIHMLKNELQILNSRID